MHLNIKRQLGLAKSVGSLSQLQSQQPDSKHNNLIYAKNRHKNLIFNTPQKDQIGKDEQKKWDNPSELVDDVLDFEATESAYDYPKASRNENQANESYQNDKISNRLSYGTMMANDRQVLASQLFKEHFDDRIDKQYS